MARQTRFDPEQTVHHESARKKRRSTGALMSVNMTPMIDVTFLLLIFFIVATHFTRTEGLLASKLPEMNPQGAPPPVPPLEVTIDPVTRESGAIDVTVDVNGDKLADGLDGLDRYLYNLHSSYPPQTTAVFVKPRPNTPWQFVLQAYNLTLRGGYSQVNWQVR